MPERNSVSGPATRLSRFTPLVAGELSCGGTALQPLPARSESKGRQMVQRTPFFESQMAWALLPIAGYR